MGQKRPKLTKNPPNTKKFDGGGGGVRGEGRGRGRRRGGSRAGAGAGMGILGGGRGRTDDGDEGTDRQNAWHRAKVRARRREFAGRRARVPGKTRA